MPSDLLTLAARVEAHLSGDPNATLHDVAENAGSTGMSLRPRCENAPAVAFANTRTVAV